ncbi:MAG: four helix bundle protein [Elusimicrobiota bacterium]
MQGLNAEGLMLNEKQPIMRKGEDLSRRCRRFAVQVIQMLQKMGGSYIERELGRQLVRATASIGANWEEAMGGYTRADFSHSANIAKKEARESLYWLRLFSEIDFLAKAPEPLLRECDELVCILTAIVKKSQSKILKFIFIFFSIQHLAFSPLLAKPLGGGAGDIWTFGAGARSLGLGNAATELSDDATAAYWNPARLSYLGKMNFNFLHAELFEGASYDYMGWAYPTLSVGTLGLSLVRLGIGAIEQRDENNSLVGNYDFQSNGLGLSYGNQFGSAFALGGSFKYLTRSLPGASSSLLSFDLAADYKAFKFGEIGIVMRDVFYAGAGTDDQLPLNVTLGASYGLFEGALKVSGQLEEKGPALRAGIEYGLGPASLRIGVGGAGQTTGGMGLRYRDFQLDYAILLHELGNSSRFSLGFWFGRDRNRQRKDLSRVYSERVAQAYREGRYVRASRLIDRALVFNPSDILLISRKEKIEKVLAYLRLSREEMKRPTKNAADAVKQKYVFTVRGLSDYIEANSEGALLLLRQAIAIDPQDEGLRRIHDAVADESGRKEEKNKPLLSPEANVGSKLAEADRYFRQGRFDLAAKSCEDAIKLEPNNALAYERMGSSYFALGLRDKAAEMWKKAIEIKPENTALKDFMIKFGLMK